MPHDFANIPAELRELPNWVVWRLEPKPGQDKPTKIPYNTRGSAAASTNPATWSTFEQALNALQHSQAEGKPYNGIGFCFQNTPYIGVDRVH